MKEGEEGSRENSDEIMMVIASEPGIADRRLLLSAHRS